MESLFIILLPILMQIESSNNPSAVGDNGHAVGILQIHKIYVRDVNRILGHDEYTYDDRWDIEKSKEMTKIYLSWYAPKMKLMSKLDKLQTLGAIHNGGPKGYEKSSTLKYRLKIAKAYARMLNDG